ERLSLEAPKMSSVWVPHHIVSAAIDPPRTNARGVNARALAVGCAFAVSKDIEVFAHGFHRSGILGVCGHLGVACLSLEKLMGNSKKI
ncbi:MAG: hypothetical protein QGH20_10985, partial [Candidatus Latescibacteria bacterium]|nr:hypothetical protein [Candidatus Latescibacterota bacterium]